MIWLDAFYLFSHKILIYLLCDYISAKNEGKAEISVQRNVNTRMYCEIDANGQMICGKNQMF